MVGAPPAQTGEQPVQSSGNGNVSLKQPSDFKSSVRSLASGPVVAPIAANVSSTEKSLPDATDIVDANPAESTRSDKAAPANTATVPEPASTPAQADLDPPSKPAADSGQLDRNGPPTTPDNATRQSQPQIESGKKHAADTKHDKTMAN